MRNILLVSALLAMALFATACGDSGGSGSCTYIHLKSQACTNCAANNCNNEITACFGSNWQAGSISGGSCASVDACARSCACNDNACYGRCYTSASASCHSCIATEEQC